MYLKSLTLKGFKSFANKTHMLFDPGLSVVVGPNGSGKSNISDAVLWVLGTQSAKQLRGQAMEDVIFSGSAERGKVSMAEVTLVLDNSDHTLPIDYVEVAITRRMFRNGDNEYLVNGAPARLMDVQDILDDSGLGRETHSVISQGKLDQIVTARPEDRRVLIEEAAGIAKHRRRKERACKKLAVMDENVRHLKMMLREVNRRIKPLEGQVEKAARAHELKERADTLELKLSVHHLREQETLWNKLKEERVQFEAMQEVAELEVKDKKIHLDKLTAILEEKGLFAGDIEASKGRLFAQSEGMRANLRLLEEKGRTMVERLSETRRNLSSISLEKHSAKVAMAELLANHAESKGELKVAFDELKELTSQNEKNLQQEALQEKKIEEMEQSITEMQVSADSIELVLVNVTSSLANAKNNIELFVQRKNELENDIEQIHIELLRNKKAEKKCAQRIEEKEKEKDTLEIKVHNVRNEFEKLNREKSSISKKLSLFEAKTKTIAELIKELQADTCRKPSFLNASQAKKVFTLLGEPKKHAAAFDLYLDGLLDVYMSDSFEKVREHLSQAQNFSLFVDELIEPIASSKKVSGTPLSSFVDKDKIDASMYRLLSRCFLVDTLEEALEGRKLLKEATFVTKDLIKIGPNGLLTKGSFGTQSYGLVSQIAEGKRAEQERKKALKKKKELEDLLTMKQKELTELTEHAGKLIRELEALKAESTMYAKEAGRLEQTKEQRLAQLARHIAHNKEAQRNIDDFEREKKKHSDALDDANRNIEKETVLLEKTKKYLREMRDTHAVVSEKITTLKLRTAGLAERIQHFETREKELKAQIGHFSERERALQISGESLEVLRRRIEPLHENISSFNELLQTWIIRLNEQILVARNDSSLHSASLRDAQDALSQAQANLSEQSEKMQKLDVQRARLEAEVKHAVERVRKIAKVPFEEAVLVKLEVSAEEAEIELANLQFELASIGPVNQVAAEEYEEFKERQTSLSEALLELKSAKKAVDSVMRSIEKKMRDAFITTFSAVDKNFQEVFGLLFPGGKAHLVLTDEQDIQRTGLEIVAQPRGKRLPKLALMSGGEKSLTALAFLFAVYKARTVPFYIFDEVEASLDDANLHKLLRAIQELKNFTQLIVITHQRATMEEADVLWGVSMGGDGVSQVLSQRLQKTTEGSV